jgi:hypothetical protein
MGVPTHKMNGEAFDNEITIMMYSFSLFTITGGHIAGTNGFGVIQREFVLFALELDI